jgi:hypothetical protein
MGIEPTPPAWEAGVLPLNYTRVYIISSVGLFLTCSTCIRLYSVLFDLSSSKPITVTYLLTVHRCFSIKSISQVTFKYYPSDLIRPQPLSQIARIICSLNTASIETA